jgi:hypothetical protein
LEIDDHAARDLVEPRQVEACAAVHRIGAQATVEVIVAVTAQQLIVARAALDEVVAPLAKQDVGAGVSHQGVGEARTDHAFDRDIGVARRVARRTGLLAKIDGDGRARIVVAHQIVARAAIHDIRAGPRIEMIPARAAVQEVAPETAHDDVVAVLTVDLVVAAVARDHVAEGRSHHGLDARVAVARRAAAAKARSQVDRHARGSVIVAEKIVAGAAIHMVRARAAVQMVVAGAGEQLVRAVAAGKHVVATAAGQSVVTPAPGQVIGQIPGKNRFAERAALEIEVEREGRDRFDARQMQSRRAGVGVQVHDDRAVDVERLSEHHGVGARAAGEREALRQGCEIGRDVEDVIAVPARDHCQLLDLAARRLVKADAVVPVAAVDFQIAEVGGDRVVSGAAGVVVGAVHALQGVVPVSAVEPILPRRAANDVIAAVAVQVVHAPVGVVAERQRPASQLVGAVAAMDGVVAQPAHENVVAAAAEHLVVAVAGDHHVGLVVAGQDIRAASGVDVLDAHQGVHAPAGVLRAGDGEIDDHAARCVPVVDDIPAVECDFGGGVRRIEHQVRGMLAPRAAIEQVVARAASEKVRPGASRQAVVAGGAVDRIGAARPNQNVVTRRARNQSHEDPPTEAKDLARTRRGGLAFPRDGDAATHERLCARPDLHGEAEALKPPT